MLYDLIQGRCIGHRSPTICKNGTKSVTSAGMHVIKGLMVNYDTMRGLFIKVYSYNH